MKQKISSIVILLILIIPVALYSAFKGSPDGAAFASAKNKPAVVEFYTPLCSECQKLKIVMDKVEPKYERKIDFQKINANTFDRNIQEQVMKYNIKAVPTTIFLDKDGHVVAKRIGSMTEETLKTQLDELLK